MTELKRSELYQKQRGDVERLFMHGLEQVSPEQIIRSSVVPGEDMLTICGRSHALPDDRRIWVFGSGKAAGRMAFELENILGKRIYDGIVICPYGLKTSTRHIQQFEAAHPVPDLNSLTATYELVDVASDVRETDLVIYLMSGGSSSLLCMPHEELDFDDARVLYRELLQCGAPIGDVNRIRKSISQVKGGRLRPRFGHAAVTLLAVSDVPGNDPADIGSGPLVDDTVSPGEALELLRKYELEKKIPHPIIRFLEKGGAPAPEKAGWKTQIHVVASVEKVAETITAEAKSMGYNTWMDTDFTTGEARTVAKKIAEIAVSVLSKDKPVKKPAALVFYGETTVTVTGSGKGGRNQELVLAAAMAFEGRHNITLLSGGTDGKDGETNAAGAIANGETAEEARKKDVRPESYLENNDSWTFFKKTDGLLVTGVTGNNLMDIQIVLVEK
ncbi:MAG: glycerate kinase type-2 family protein [Bacteroidota bacterium]